MKGIYKEPTPIIYFMLKDLMFPWKQCKNFSYHHSFLNCTKVSSQWNYWDKKNKYWGEGEKGKSRKEGRNKNCVHHMTWSSVCTIVRKTYTHIPTRGHYENWKIYISEGQSVFKEWVVQNCKINHFSKLIYKSNTNLY